MICMMIMMIMMRDIVIVISGPNYRPTLAERYAGPERVKLEWDVF